MSDIIKITLEKQTLHVNKYLIIYFLWEFCTEGIVYPPSILSHNCRAEIPWFPVIFLLFTFNERKTEVPNENVTTGT